MSQIPPEIAEDFRDRRVVLWLVQRYELKTGCEPHSLGASIDEIAPLYRTAPDARDAALMSWYWEAIWTEGVSGIVANAAKGSASTQGRRPIEIARAEDAQTAILTTEFQPIYEVHGLLDRSAPPGIRFDSISARQRERGSWALREQLRKYPNRTLVVVGAQIDRDLDLVRETLTDASIFGIKVLVLGDTSAVHVPGVPEWHLPGNVEDLHGALQRLHAPIAQDQFAWSIRLGSGRVTLAPGEAAKVSKRFALITESDLARPSKVDLSSVESFFRAVLTDWRGFAAGICFPRAYEASAGIPLPAYMVQTLREHASRTGRLENPLVLLPAEGGSGATTLIRSAAWASAQAGFPTLVLHPAQVDIDVEEISAFALALTDKALLGEGDRDIPLLLVFDVEHDAPSISELALRLANQGRPAVVLRAVRTSGNVRPPAPTRHQRVLPVLSQIVTDTEVTRLHHHYEALRKQEGLAFELPTLTQWQAYKSAQTIQFDGADDVEGLFWVALQFFLLEGDEYLRKNGAADHLTEWIERRAKSIESDPAFEVVVKVAALSSFRLPAPLWPTIRPVFGGSFSSELTDALRKLDDLLLWVDVVAAFEEPAIAFKHPAMARQFLRRRGLGSADKRLGCLREVAEQLSPGPPADVWLAETLSMEVLSPRRLGTDSVIDTALALQAFSWMPTLLAESSKTILHHWARTLYRTADDHTQPAVQRESLFRESTSLLQKAIALPRRRDKRGEHPSHLLNTLATAYVRWALFLESTPGQKPAEDLWVKAFDTFDKALTAGHGENLDSIFAFAQRSVQRAKALTSKGDASHGLEHAITALALLDQAEDILAATFGASADDDTFIAEQRAYALQVLSTQSATAYINDIRSRNAPLAAYCQARLALSDEHHGPRQAVAILEEARDSGVPLTAPALALLIKLLKQDSTTRFAFDRLLGLYRLFEQSATTRWFARDQFNIATLCYQVGQFEEGAERFRRLRQYARDSDVLPPRFTEYWRDVEPPYPARKTTARIVNLYSEWRGQAYVPDLRQELPIRPRHFQPPPSENDWVSCVVRFEFSGPKAVPERFAKTDIERQR
jgi:hypothetical protein